MRDELRKQMHLYWSYYNGKHILLRNYVYKYVEGGQEKREREMMEREKKETVRGRDLEGEMDAEEDMKGITCSEEVSSLTASLFGD